MQSKTQLIIQGTQNPGSQKGETMDRICTAIARRHTPQKLNMGQPERKQRMLWRDIVAMDVTKVMNIRGWEERTRISGQDHLRNSGSM